jgi:hypothetical protein
MDKSFLLLFFKKEGLPYRMAPAAIVQRTRLKPAMMARPSEACSPVATRLVVPGTGAAAERGRAGVEAAEIGSSWTVEI